VRKVSIGVLIGIGAMWFAVACGVGGLSPVARCKLDALKVLPSDPRQATLGDAIDIIERVRACHRAAEDGGAP
jgi:hypothetical protein